MRIVRLAAAALLLAWVAVIYRFSSQPLEKQNLKPWLARHLPAEAMERWLGGVRFRYGGHTVDIAAMGAPAFAEFLIRKAAHFTEYAVLGGLVYALLRFSLRRARGWMPTAAVAICFAFAAADEYHQSFVAQRTPLFEDVLLDTIGASFGLLLSMAVVRLSGRARRSASRTSRIRERVG